MKSLFFVFLDDDNFDENFGKRTKNFSPQTKRTRRVERDLEQSTSRSKDTMIPMTRLGKKDFIGNQFKNSIPVYWKKVPSIFGKEIPYHFGRDSLDLKRDTIPKYWGEIPEVFGRDSPVFGKDSSVFGKDSPIFGKDSPVFGNDNPVFGRDSPVFGKDSPIFGRDSLDLKKEKDTIPQYWGKIPAVFGKKDSQAFGKDIPVFGKESRVFRKFFANETPLFHQEDEMKLSKDFATFNKDEHKSGGKVIKKESPMLRVLCGVRGENFVECSKKDEKNQDKKFPHAG